MKIAVVSVIAIVMLTGFFVIEPDSVSATPSFWMSSTPPAYNCSYWTDYPRYTTPATEQEGPKVLADSSTLDLAGSTGVYKWVKTNDFTDLASWVDPGDSTYIQFAGFMPPVGANIISVFLTAAFLQYRPYMQLSFSINDESSWTYSSGIAEYLGSTSPAYNWNITSLTTWTPELLNSTSLWARLKASPTTGTHYYLDYLGFIVHWWAELEGGGSGGLDDLPGSDTDVVIDYDIIYGEGGLVGVLGFIGLIGMIAVPALSIFVYRQNEGEGKMNIFIKMLVLFMFCLTCFMVSVSGA